MTRRTSSCAVAFSARCCLDRCFPDCSGKKPLEGPLKQELERALALAERFTRQYDSLLKRFEEQMFNTSSILDLFNRQYGWVSSLANGTGSEDGVFRVQTVRRPAPSAAARPGARRSLTLRLPLRCR